MAHVPLYLFENKVKTPQVAHEYTTHPGFLYIYVIFSIKGCVSGIYVPLEAFLL